MPKEYLEMKEKFKSKGQSDKAAKTKAAKIYNASHEDSVVAGEYEKGLKKKKSVKKEKKEKTFFTA